MPKALRRKIPIVPVPEIADLVADEEKRARGAIVPIEIGERARLHRRLDAAPDRHAAAARRQGARHRRAAAGCGEAAGCARRCRGDGRARRPSARGHPRHRFLDGLGRADLHPHARRSRRRRHQDRGDPVSGLVARRRPPAGLCAGQAVREDGALLHHEPQQARHHARPDAGSGPQSGAAPGRRCRPRGRQLFGRGAAEARARLRHREQAQPETGDDVDVGLRRRQPASRLPRLWLDPGAGLRPAERGR